MELKHYRKEGNVYMLVEPWKQNRKKVLVALFAMAAIVYGLIYISDGRVDTNALARIAVLLGLCALFSAINVRTTLYIRPDERIVVEKKKKTETVYRFDQFLNFQRTRMRMYGLITISWSAAMYFNVAGKNKKIFLTSHKTAKELEEIIGETTVLLTQQPV